LAWWPLQQGFGLSTASTVLCVAVLSATGTGVTLRALGQASALNTPSGRLLVGVSVLDDLPAIALLTLAVALGAAPGATRPYPALLPPALALGLVLLSLPACSWWLRRYGPWRPGLLGVLLLLIGAAGSVRWAGSRACLGPYGAACC
jgi:Kef-type K+ transport system membrane component KefB